MKKVAIAGISILFTVLTFWACQKELGKNELAPVTESTEAVTSRDFEPDGLCSKTVTITGANLMYLCGVAPYTLTGRHCSVCQDGNRYDQYLIDGDPITVNIPNSSFSIWNPIGGNMHSRRVTFQVPGSTCSDTFDLATGVIYSFYIYRDPTANCCRVKMYCS